MDNLQDLVTTQTLEEDGDGQAEPTDLWAGNEPAEDAYAELTEGAAEQADEPADAEAGQGDLRSYEAPQQMRIRWRRCIDDVGGRPALHP